MNNIHKRLPLHYTNQEINLSKFPCTNNEFVANNSNQSLESHVTIVPPEMTVECFQENNKDVKGHGTSRIGSRLDLEYYIKKEILTM
nr:3435_t:CDS:2 [Entrophospora candida]